MMVQHLKRRPLSRYLKDFKHSQTHCAHCRKLLDRITLVRDGKIVNKIEISRLDTLLDENGWQVEQQSWAALCRFCGDLHCKTQSDFFDIIGFKQFLFEQTEMSPGTVREYVVRLRRLGNHLHEQNISLDQLQDGFLDEILAPCLYKVLSSIADKLQAGERDLDEIIAIAGQELNEKGFRADDIQIRDADTLLEVSENSKRAVILVAAWLGDARLIDNKMVELA